MMIKSYYAINQYVSIGFLMDKNHQQTIFSGDNFLLAIKYFLSIILSIIFMKLQRYQHCGFFNIELLFIQRRMYRTTKRDPFLTNF